jgi:hypothetical protein
MPSTVTSLSAMWPLRPRSAGFAAQCGSLTASRDRFSQLMTSGFDVVVFSTPIGFRPGIRPGGFVGLGSFHLRHRSNPAALELARH